MAKNTPAARGGILRIVGQPSIRLDTPEWFAWLQDDNNRSFHFSVLNNSFTARKERKQRGNMYWVAYRQVQGKLYKRYLGSAEKLTEEFLQAEAEKLTQQSIASTDTERSDKSSKTRG